MKLHIYGALTAYKKRRPARFHMPGHKANGRWFRPFRDAALDVTELSATDCLENPDGPIAEAQADIARLLGAGRSHILTDGASSGVFCLLYIAKRRGGKVLISRNSHKSVYNACGLLGVEPHIVQNTERDGVLLPPTAADIESALQKDPKIGTVLLTSPDYFGNVANYGAIAKVCKRYDKLLFVDGAHGAYLRFDPDEESLYAGRYADAWVDSSHKTMPTLTQGALLNVNKEDLYLLAEEALGVFRTTSPSFPVMASVEYGVKLLDEQGTELIDVVKRELALLKARFKKRGIAFYGGSKTLVLAVDFAAAGISAQAAQDALERRGIFAELNDGRYVLFYFSPLTPPRQLARLERGVRAVLRMRPLRGSFTAAHGFACGLKKFGYLTALSLPNEKVPLAEAVGRVAARNAGITPPCYPVAVAGEQITAEAARELENARHTFGVEDGCVTVIHIGGRA